MIYRTRMFQIPRPKTFLYFLSLRTGTSLATLTLLLNKVSGLYGLLALLTGLHLSPLQLSMYIYSLFALVITAHLAPHIRTQSPFYCLALAWFYVLDTLVNAAYTAVFSVTWFLVISQHHSTGSFDSAIPGAGGSMIDDIAGFTSPKYNVSRVDVAAAPIEGLTAAGQEAVAMGTPSDAAAGAATTLGGPSLGHGVLQPESISSVIVICGLWAIRVYLMLIVLSYARFVLRQHISTASRMYTPLHAGNADSNYAENPFASHLPNGQGWKGRVGRNMVRLGRSYWLGKDEDEESLWVAQMNAGAAKFGAKKATQKELGEVPGVMERERRRRSGTGPRQPPPQLLTGSQGKHLKVHELTDVR